MFYIILCSALLSLFVPLNSIRIPLTGTGWTINNNQTYSAQGQIPGTIHTILLAANQITEPYWNYNDVNLRSLVYSSWTFRKTFSLASDFLTFNEFKLHFDQIDTVANITLNWCHIGQTNNMFLAYTFNVMKACLQSDNNQLQIDFQSPVVYALTQAQAYNDTVPPNCPPNPQHGECHVQFIRKEPCSFSWDWGPAFAPIGITGDVYLEGVNTADISIQLESVNVAAYQPALGLWKVDILLSSNNDPFTSQLKFVLENTPFTFEYNYTFDRNLSVSLAVPDENIQRWWPNGYGNQTLYTLSVYSGEQFIGSRLVGFRTVQLIQHDYGPNIKGLSFYFLINYQEVFIKGSNWIPPDAFQERVTDERLERLLRSAQLANMNMLRVWGGGIYERDSFYEIADRLGIMLWHDFMFACSLYPVDESFLTNVHNEVVYQVKRLQSHASIVLWSGNNENEAAIAENWYGVPAEKMPKVKDDYRKLYVDTVMNAVNEVDEGDNRPFITSSPTNGVESISENYIAANPQDPLYGDVHFYGYQDDSWNSTTYPITRFVSETGIQSLPSLSTWSQANANLSDLNFDSPFILHREHGGNQMPAMMTHIESNLPLPVTNDSLRRFTEMIYLSQIHQAMTLKSISDVCRGHSSIDMIDPETSQGHTMGLMYWQINDIWQAPTWSTIEYGLKWKMAHYYVQHMYAPVYPLTILTPYLADAEDRNAQISLYVISERSNAGNGSLMCSFLSLDTFSPRLLLSFNVSFNSPSLQHITNLSYATLMRSAECSNSSECLMHCSYNSSQDQIGQTLFFARPKQYQLYQPNLRISSIRQTTPTAISITVTATRPALFVWLEAPDNATGYFSRNGFHMFEPERTIIFHSWLPMADVNTRNFDLRIMSLFDVTEP